MIVVIEAKLIQADAAGLPIVAHRSKIDLSPNPAIIST